jgi:hypothetical protein
MQVTISATSIGGNAGPFNIYQDFDSYVTPVATSVSRASILAGYVVTVNDATTTVRLISSGICTNSTNISVISPTPTPTPTATPSATPPVNIIYWSFNRQISGTLFSITKNGSTVVSTSLIGDSGQFNHTPGDSIIATTNENVKSSDWTQTCAFLYGGSLIASDKAQDETTSVSFTTSAGSYSVTGQEDTTEMFACMSPEP